MLYNIYITNVGYKRNKRIQKRDFSLAKTITTGAANVTRVFKTINTKAKLLTSDSWIKNINERTKTVKVKIFAKLYNL